MPIYLDGVYLEESRINYQKYYAVIKDRKLLMWTTDKRTANLVLTENKPKNDQPNS